MALISITKTTTIRAKSQSTRHKRLLYNIQIKLTGTCDEIFIERYVMIITYIRQRFINDYIEILKDLEFIIYNDEPIEKVLMMLETYMTTLDILHDVELSRLEVNFDIDHESIF